MRRQNPKDPKLLLFSGQLHFYQKNWGQAAHYFTAYLERTPRMWRCAGNWPRPCLFLPKARMRPSKAYGEALKLNDDPGLRLRRISLLLEDRRWDEAARELQACPIPEDPRLLREQARLLVWLGRSAGSPVPL